VHCVCHAEQLGAKTATEKGGREMRPLQEAIVVTRNARNVLNYPARLAVFHEVQTALALPLHKLLESGKTRFLTKGDAAVRMFEQLAAVIGCIQKLVATTTDSKVCYFMRVAVRGCMREEMKFV
jgi:hypothetical protein